jgi:hypothetical protein
LKLFWLFSNLSLIKRKLFLLSCFNFPAINQIAFTASKSYYSKYQKHYSKVEKEEVWRTLLISINKLVRKSFFLVNFPTQWGWKNELSCVTDMNENRNVIKIVIIIYIINDGLMIYEDTITSTHHLREISRNCLFSSHPLELPPFELGWDKAKSPIMSNNYLLFK